MIKGNVWYPTIAAIFDINRLTGSTIAIGSITVSNNSCFVIKKGIIPSQLSVYRQFRTFTFSF